MRALVVLVCLALLSVSHAFVNSARRFQLNQPESIVSDVKTIWFDQRVDHFDHTNLNTWKQKILVSQEYFNPKLPNAPVYVYISGENTMSNSIKGYMHQLANATSGLMFAMEHRYYGESQPVSDWSNSNMKYLSTHQALEDLAYFIKSMDMPERPWVVMGGSYAGVLAALLRQKYPNLVWSSISSSAPLLAKVDFHEYSQVMKEAFVYFGGDKCLSRMKQASEAFLASLATEEGRKEAEKRLNLCTPLQPLDQMSKLDYWTFSDLMVESIAGIVQYNKPNSGRYDINAVCADLETHLHDPKEAFYKIQLSANNGGFSTCNEWKYEGFIRILKDTTIDHSKNMRQWFYQTCTEYGFYQTYSDNTFGGIIDVDLWYNMCQDVYGIKREIVDDAAKRTNIRYNGLDVRTTNTHYINGNIDPWYILGVYTPIETPVPQDIHFTWGTSHCQILGAPNPSDLPALVQSRIDVQKAVMKDLSTFVPPKRVK